MFFCMSGCFESFPLTITVLHGRLAGYLLSQPPLLHVYDCIGGKHIANIPPKIFCNSELSVKQGSTVVRPSRRPLPYGNHLATTSLPSRYHMVARW